METLNNEDILIKISNLKFKYNKKQKEHNVDIEYNDNNIWTIVLKDSTIEVNDKVDITFSDADVLVFDDEGNRVYA